MLNLFCRFCYGDYRCSLTRKTLNQDDIFEEDNNMVLELLILLDFIC